MEVLRVDDMSVRLYGTTILDRISFVIQAGEQWAITGPSGSGKTTLLKALSGRQFFTGSLQFHENNADASPKLVLVEQQHHFKNLSNTNNFYYQQRFNSHDADDAISVKEYLQSNSTHDLHADAILKTLVELFEIGKVFDEPLIQLSNGENKRVQIVKALINSEIVFSFDGKSTGQTSPGHEPIDVPFLLLDNPFIGLDAKSREDLEKILSEVIAVGVQVIMVVSTGYMPHFVTNVLSLKGNGTAAAKAIIPSQWNQEHVKQDSGFSVDHTLLQELISGGDESQFEFAVQMKRVNIQYDRKILDNITWEVRRGERWSLSGPNGSGKSTLLSLVNADNPQAYANDIRLFDRKRGTGESIWDIKKKTGFVSPELHLYFEKGISCFDVIASGFFDTIGLFRQVHEEQSILVKKWIQLFQIEKVERKYLHQLSNSEQRLVLLARALVKNPPLLILDEPCQGLDDNQLKFFKGLINDICVRGNKTLIYVSHYPHEVPECVTKFIRLENGRRVE